MGLLDLLLLRDQQSTDRCTLVRRGISDSIERSVLLVWLSWHSPRHSGRGMVC